MSGGGGVWTLTWPNIGIRAKVTRVKTEGDVLKGEVEFYSTRPNSAGHLKRRRINFLNPDAKHINELYKEDEDVNWRHVVEQLSVAVTDEHRRGIPAIDMTDAFAEDEEARWLIHPLVQVGHPTLVYGKGSSGKSWLGQYLSVLVHEGLSLGGLTVEQARVLYLDWETDARELRARLARIRNGLGLTGSRPPGLVYKAMIQGLSVDIETIQELVQEHNIQFVVIDSVGAACMGEPESSSSVIEMFNAIRSLGVTTLAIDHINKEGKLFGSEYKFNYSRLIFEAKKSQEEDDDKLEFAMFHRKANNSKMIKPLGYVLEFDNERFSTVLTKTAVRDTKLAGEMTVLAQITSLLRGGPLSVDAIASEIGKSPAHVSKEISTHKVLFVKLKDGTIANAAHELGDEPTPGVYEYEA